MTLEASPAAATDRSSPDPFDDVPRDGAPEGCLTCWSVSVLTCGTVTTCRWCRHAAKPVLCQRCKTEPVFRPKRPTRVRAHLVGFCAVCRRHEASSEHAARAKSRRHATRTIRRVSPAPAPTVKVLEKVTPGTLCRVCGEPASPRYTRHLGNLDLCGPHRDAARLGKLVETDGDL